MHIIIDCLHGWILTVPIGNTQQRISAAIRDADCKLVLFDALNGEILHMSRVIVPSLVAQTEGRRASENDVEGGVLAVPQVSNAVLADGR